MHDKGTEFIKNKSVETSMNKKKTRQAIISTLTLEKTEH